MAWTNAVNHKTTFGNMKVHILSCTADAAEAAIDTGLARVYAISVGPTSLSTAAVKLKLNVGSTSTALAGKLGASGFTSGDVFTVIAIGR